VGEEVVEHVPHLVHPFYRRPGEDLHHRQGPVPHLDLDHPVIQPSLPEHNPEFLPRVLRGVLACFEPHRGWTAAARGDQQVEEAFLGQLGRPLTHGSRPLPLEHVDGDVDQIPDDGVDIPPDVADLGELGRLDLQEGGLGQLGQSPRDFCLTDAGGTDHDDVLRGHLVPKVRGQSLPPPPVPDRDGNRPLGRVLADDILIQLGDDLSRRQRVHRISPIRPARPRAPHSSSMVI